MTDASQGALYPRYCFHLSPTFNTWCLLRTAQIHHLAQHAGFEGEKFFFYKKLPIKWVRIVGVVVAVDQFAGRRVFTVDDSSGACIEAMMKLPVVKPSTDAEVKADKPVADTAAPQQPAQPYDDVVAGTVVDVKGQLSTFREERQINIEKMAVLKSTAQEVALWGKMVKFRREVLDKPWVLRNRDIRRCRKEAERSEDEEEKKRRRLKAITEREIARGAMKPPQALAITAAVEKDTKKTTSREMTAANLRKLIQGSAASGKYSALGL